MTINQTRQPVTVRYREPVEILGSSLGNKNNGTTVGQSISHIFAIMRAAAFRT
jgi:hypothetical protein